MSASAVALPRTWLVLLAASGRIIGTVEASCQMEALGAACVLATASGARPQRLEVRAAAVGRA
jgi:hypothetical protein